VKAVNNDKIVCRTPECRPGGKAWRAWAWPRRMRLRASAPAFGRGGWPRKSARCFFCFAGCAGPRAKVFRFVLGQIYLSRNFAR
jgi:hypothetical protein